MNLEKINSVREKLQQNLSGIIIGKEGVIDLLIMALLCNGHMLIEDIPGTGKTILAKSLALSIHSTFKRIQFTPDMLPSDLTGVSIFNQENKKLEFQKGPLFANIVLGDEINRATPKTQSALLEAMEERQITVDGKTHQLPAIFIVIATQNPIDYEGTFQLPEAQLDRFLIKFSIGYPELKAEQAMMESQRKRHPIEAIKPAVTKNDVTQAQVAVKEIHVSNEINEYITAIVSSTRHNENIFLGASPRGSLALYRLGQCAAAFNGRDYVIPDDIKAVSRPALEHRIIFQPSFKMQDLDAEEFLEELVDSVKVPGG